MIKGYHLKYFTTTISIIDKYALFSLPNPGSNQTDIKIAVETQTPILKSFKMLLKSLCINISYHVQYDFCIELQKKEQCTYKVFISKSLILSSIFAHPSRLQFPLFYKERPILKCIKLWFY